jgi:hypothetical protein
MSIDCINKIVEYEYLKQKQKIFAKSERVFDCSLEQNTRNI